MSKQMTLSNSQDTTFKKPSQLKELLRRLRKSKGAMVGLTILIFILLIVIFADLIAPYDLAVTQDAYNKLQPPSAQHLLGTDSYGRDVLARLVHGARNSLFIALLASCTSCIFGSLLGAIAGYFGGKVDMIIMRCLDIFMSIPDLLFTMVVVAALGSSVPVLIIAMTLAYFTIITLRAEWFKGHFREADLQAMYQCRPVIAGIASATIADTGNTVIPYAAPPALPEPAAAALRHVRASRCGRAPGSAQPPHLCDSYHPHPCLDEKRGGGFPLPRGCDCLPLDMGDSLG